MTALPAFGIHDSVFQIPYFPSNFRIPSGAASLRGVGSCPYEPEERPEASVLIRKAPVQLTRLREQVKDSRYIFLSNAMNSG